MNIQVSGESGQETAGFIPAEFQFQSRPAKADASADVKSAVSAGLGACVLDGS